MAQQHPGPARRRLGRPRLYTERLSDELIVTVTPSQRQEVEARAQAAGLPVTTYARRLLLVEHEASRAG